MHGLKRRLQNALNQTRGTSQQQITPGEICPSANPPSTDKPLHGNGSKTGIGDISTLQERGHFYLALTLVFCPYCVSSLASFTCSTAKLFGTPHVAMFDGLQLFSLLGLAGMLEFVGGLLILVGLFTRQTAFILSGQMAVAYFMAHAKNDIIR